MHVTRIACAVVLCAAACKPEPPKRTAPRLSSARVDAGAPDVDETTLKLARAARDAAKQIAERCVLERDYSDNAIRYFDVCNWSHEDLLHYREAAMELRTRAPDAGPAIVFIEHVRLFGEWLELVDARPSRNGTLAHYQDFAQAWNALRPSEAIAVDVAQPAKRKDAGTLVWQRCSSGACLVDPD